MRPHDFEFRFFLESKIGKKNDIYQLAIYRDGHFIVSTKTKDDELSPDFKEGELNALELKKAKSKLLDLNNEIPETDSQNIQFQIHIATLEFVTNISGSKKDLKDIEKLNNLVNWINQFHQSRENLSEIQLKI